ncbi:hypothetical protein F511_30671 [Dorcoceras hygrometricum]|uniref:Uncharacterized protein n=1 Tax=Dorcoceras hygrometricum TaxID=472368 RepID=A0A2Z7ADX0_9LAMI|nr:hypothetical protein F511_30671 [Dorcoceras hygrometricum]
MDQLVCFWKFGPQCPTSPLLPPLKDPLEDLILQLVYRPDPTTSSCNLHDLISAIDSSILSVDCVPTAERHFYFATVQTSLVFTLLLKSSLRLDLCDWMHSNSWFIVSHDWMCCCLRLVVQLVVTKCLQLVVQSLVSNSCDWTSQRLGRSNDVVPTYSNDIVCYAS